MSSYRNRTRDQRIADEVSQDVGAQFHPELMCRAHGCPNRWSIDAPDRVHLCAAHAWADKNRWPQITQDLLDAEARRLQRGPAPKPPVRHYSREERRDVLRRMSQTAAPSKGWAHQLRDREERGENLSLAQKEAWRAALGHREPERDFFPEEQYA